MNTNPKLHLAKYLKMYANYTKSEVKNLIKEGRVLVNQEPQPLSYIIRDADIVLVDNKLITKVPLVYYLYHKPVGVVCTNNMEIKDNIISKVHLAYRVFCVGRLDKDSSGLVILTNDGFFAQRLMHAGEHIEKEYLVTVEKEITEELLDSFRSPIVIRGKKTSPAKVKKLDDKTLQIILTDGKYRQIRRLVVRGKNRVKTLKRVRIAHYQLNGLKENEIVEFEEENQILI